MIDNVIAHIQLETLSVLFNLCLIADTARSSMSNMYNTDVKILICLVTPF